MGGEGLLQHGLGERSRRQAAVVLTFRILDLADHHQLRIIGREERGERRRVLVDVAASYEPTRRAGLAQQRKAGELSALPGASRVDGPPEKLTEPRRDLRAHSSPHRLRLPPVDQHAIGPAHLPEKRRLQQHAVVCDRAVCGRQLDRGHPEFVPHGEARARVHRLPAIRPGEAAARLGRELDTRRASEPEIAQGLILLHGRQPLGELRHGDIARYSDRLGERQVAMLLVGIGDAPGRPSCRLHHPHSAFGVHCIVVADLPGAEQRGCGEQLGGGAGLERIGQRGRPRRAVGPLGSDGEQLAGAGVEQHYVAPFGLETRERVAERALRDLLQRRVQGQVHVVAGDRLADPAGG